MNINYQLICDRQIEKMTSEGRVPSLLLHSCCGPCSSYVLEYLSRFFSITVLYYNPNIYPEREFQKRLETQREVLLKMAFKNPVRLMEARPYDYGEFLKASKNLEKEKEGGKRCVECFKLRLFETARLAAELGMDCFTTTLSVSPHKNAEILNLLGKEAESLFGVEYLEADFKKREGYKRSIELSKVHNLYRQEYCGCEFSINRE